MKKLLSCLAPAVMLLFASCSSEPSDWRPENKVSDDMIPPGTRPSDNFDQATDYAPSQKKGGAISEPVSSGVRLEKQPAPTAAGVMTADTQEGTAKKRGEGNPNAADKNTDAATPNTTQDQAGAQRQ
jgi:hypothetical protein